MLIYPEGTRHTGQARPCAGDHRRAPAHDRALANRLENVLPPRLGGPLALLDGRAGIDIVFCGHVGFDGFQHVSDIWAGGLVGTTIAVRFWRYPAAEIPADHEGASPGCTTRWQVLDDWVGEHRLERPGVGSDGARRPGECRPERAPEWPICRLLGSPNRTCYFGRCGSHGED